MRPRDPAGSGYIHQRLRNKIRRYVITAEFYRVEILLARVSARQLICIHQTKTLSLFKYGVKSRLRCAIGGQRHGLRKTSLFIQFVQRKLNELQIDRQMAKVNICDYNNIIMYSPWKFVYL